jgi:hypothetical protein
VPCHHPQEMQQLLYNVNDVVSREKSFPLKLHSQRVASDKGMGEMASNYNDIIKMLESNIKDIAKVDDSIASAMREVVECLKDQFEQFRNLSLQNEATMSKNFAEYKDILTEQFGSVMALELANLHNGLSVWRHNFMQSQIGMSMNLKQTALLEANEGRELVTKLQKSLSSLTLRHGLLATEKEASDQRAIAVVKQLNNLINNIRNSRLYRPRTWRIPNASLARRMQR